MDNEKKPGLLYGPDGQKAIDNGQWRMANFFMVQMDNGKWPTGLWFQMGNGQMETMDAWRQRFTEAKITSGTILNLSRESLYTTASWYQKPSLFVFRHVLFQTVDTTDNPTTVFQPKKYYTNFKRSH